MAEYLDRCSYEAVAIAEGLGAVARALQFLGNGDAATNMGALEAHGKLIEELHGSALNSVDGISSALLEIATVIRENTAEAAHGRLGSDPRDHVGVSDLERDR